MGPQWGPLENEYPETRFLSAFQTRGSIRVQSRALGKGSSERMVLFHVQSPQTQCFQRFAGFLMIDPSQKNSLMKQEKPRPRALDPSRGLTHFAKTQYLCGFQQFAMRMCLGPLGSVNE